MSDFILDYIMPILVVILVAMMIIIMGFAIYGLITGNFYTTKIEINKDYIENLETKVNILTNYDEYCLEDSLKQQEAEQ